MISFNEPVYNYIKDLFTLALSITGLIIAGQGLSTWKKQIKGGREFEIAYNLHLSTLKLRDAIKHVRNPAIWNAESYEAIQYFKKKHPDRKDDQNIEKNSSVYVYEMRWEEITIANTEMESHLLAAEVLWGPELRDNVKSIRKNVTTLNIGLQQYLNPEFRTKNSGQLRDIVYDASDDSKKDEFSQEIDRAVESIANFLKPKIK